MSRNLYAVYGASGFGREVMPLARAAALKAGASPDEIVFIDDNPTSTTANGHRVVSYNQFLQLNASERYVSLAIANSQIRERLSVRCNDDGVKEWSLTASNVVIMDEVQVDNGAILSPFVTLTSNIRIGRQFHANIYSYVAHDCIIGDYVTLAPSVKCNGNVVIEDHAYIGTGAVLKQGTPDKPLVIGRGAVVGMGAVVTKSVAPDTVVVGNPAKVFIKG